MLDGSRAPNRHRKTVDSLPAIPRVTTKVLREQLRQMLADDLITREELTPHHLSVRYAVSTYGETLGPVFDTLWYWGVIHLAQDESARGTAVVAPLARPDLE